MFISTEMVKTILVGPEVHSILTLPPCKVSSSGYPWRQPRKPRLITRSQLLQLQGIWNILTKKICQTKIILEGLRSFSCFDDVSYGMQGEAKKMMFEPFLLPSNVLTRGVIG